MPQAAIFDLDGTLLDSVDLHAMSWQEAMVKFGHKVSFEQARSQIGKGGDKLIPFFLSPEEQKDVGNWKSGAAGVSKADICRWSALFRQCQICCSGYGGRGSALP